MDPSSTGEGAGTSSTDTADTSAAETADTGTTETGVEGGDAAETETGGEQATEETPVAAEGEQTEEVEQKAEPAKTEPEPPKRRSPDLTARLAALSREKREIEKAARQEAARRTQLEQQLNPIVDVIQRARSGDPKAIKELHELSGVDFQKVVNVYAEIQEKEPTPEEQAKAQLDAVNAKLAAIEKAEQERQAAAAQAAQAQQRAATIASIEQTLKAGGDKYEISARLGTEAAEAVFGEIIKAWNEAGQPQLMPGEFEEAVVEAAALVERRYEDRGKLLQKAAKVAATSTKQANGAANGKPNGATKITPKASPDAELSDTDSAILEGLLAKTAPAETRQTTTSKPKPRTINSALGGSAPSRTRPSGNQDPRDALREVLSGIR